MKHRPRVCEMRANRDYAVNREQATTPRFAIVWLSCINANAGQFAIIISRAGATMPSLGRS